MATIEDYIEWRGDVPFEISPFNEVDNYIIAKIGTPDYTGIVPDDNTEMPIAEAVEAWTAQNPDVARVGVLNSSRNIPVLKRLPGTVRFGSLTLSGFVNRVSIEGTEQFSALTVRLPDGTHYVSYRGTDDYVVAWKENCSMAFLETVPAQKDAAAYLKWAAENYEGALIVGGHSKGGNLAVYAASMAEPAVQDRIKIVYTNDGPGFSEAFLASEGYQRIRNRVYSILPYRSIVGTLLNQVETTTVAECSKHLFASHDGFNWHVTPRGFVRCAGLAPASRIFDDAFAEALAQKDLEERKEFIEEFFNMLEDMGYDTLTKLADGNLKSAIQILKGMRGNTETAKFFRLLIEEIIKETAGRAKGTVSAEHGKLRAGEASAESGAAFEPGNTAEGTDENDGEEQT